MNNTLMLISLCLILLRKYVSYTQYTLYNTVYLCTYNYYNIYCVSNYVNVYIYMRIILFVWTSLVEIKHCSEVHDLSLHYIRIYLIHNSFQANDSVFYVPL